MNMKIDINEDFETVFQDTVWNGFTGNELLLAVISLGLSGFVGFLLWKHTGISIDVCIYCCIPIILAVNIAGKARYQGMGATEFIREGIYTNKTKKLPYEAEERPQGQDRIFSMKTKKGGRKRDGSFKCK